MFYSIKNFTSGDNTLIESIKVDYIEAINRIQLRSDLKIDFYRKSEFKNRQKLY